MALLQLYVECLWTRSDHVKTSKRCEAPNARGQTRRHARLWPRPSAHPAQPARVCRDCDRNAAPHASRPPFALGLRTALPLPSVNTFTFKQHAGAFCKNCYWPPVLPQKCHFVYINMFKTNVLHQKCSLSKHYKQRNFSNLPVLTQTKGGTKFLLENMYEENLQNTWSTSYNTFSVLSRVSVILVLDCSLLTEVLSTVKNNVYFLPIFTETWKERAAVFKGADNRKGSWYK